MSGAILVIAVLVWLVAAYAFVRVVMAWWAVVRLAPEGRKFNAALALGWWNFPEVRRIAGEGAARAIGDYRSGFKLFIICLIPFFGLVLLNILSGNAA